MPNVSNPIQDSQIGVIYNVVAYRALSHAERTQAVRYYLSQPNVKKPKRGTEVTIITIVGFNE